MLLIKPSNKVLNNIVSRKGEDKYDIKQNQTTFHMTVTLFSDVHFVLLLISGCVFFFGAAVVYTHLIAFAKSQGMSSPLRNVMISLIGFMSLLGRITLGMLSQHPKISTMVVYTVAMFLSGNNFFLLHVTGDGSPATHTLECKF